MRILIEIPTWLGDAVMTTPAIENIIKYFPKAEVIIFGSNEVVKIFSLNKKIAKTLIIEKSIKKYLLNINKLKKIDLFISFRNSIYFFLITFLLKPKKSHKYSKNYSKNIHQVEKYNDYISSILGFKLKPGKIFLGDFNSKISKTKQNKLLGINPGGAYGSAKRWHPDKFAEIAKKYSSSYDILIFGGKNEINDSKAIATYLDDSGVKNYTNLSGETNLIQLIAKISILDLFITNDSGPMHIAAAFNIPTLSIFGPTNNYETSQWLNTKSSIAKIELDCQPCKKRECPLSHNNCMKLIKPEAVIKIINHELIS